MTPTAVPFIRSRRLLAMVVSATLVGSLFAPTAARAAGPSVTISIAGWPTQSGQQVADQLHRPILGSC